MKNRLFIYLYYPVILFSITLIIYSLYLWSINFTPRMYYYSEKMIYSQINHSTVIGNFYSSENYLGIISFSNLGDYIDSTANTLTISLIENDNIIHTNTYNAYDLINLTDFSFGFPIQKNSKNINYSLKLELFCFADNPCNFMVKESDLIIRHYFSKQYLFSNLNLVLEKIIINLNNQAYLLNISVFFLPITIYYIWAIFLLKKTKPYIIKINNLIFKNFSMKELLLYLFPFIHIIISKNYLFIILLILFIFLLYLFFSKNKKYILFRILILTYLLSIVFTTINYKLVADQISLWTLAIFLLYSLSNLFVPKNVK